MKIDYSFYLILDEESCGKRAADEMLSEIVDGGITIVQLRIKNKSTRHIKKIGEMVLTITREKKIPLIINDYVELAKKIDADGVHIGLKDTPYEYARKFLGYEKIIGLSIENMEQVRLYHHVDVDYFGVGPIFKTITKMDAASPMGIAVIKKITQSVTKPVVAIGGINEKNIFQVFAAGVSGIAVVSAVLKAPHPLEATQNIARLILDILEKKMYANNL